MNWEETYEAWRAFAPGCSDVTFGSVQWISV